MDSTNDKKSCNYCFFGLFEDNGYSNWTVEGSAFYCMLCQHPDDGFDGFYGEDKRFAFAEECEYFRKGKPIRIDVDCEVFDNSDVPTDDEEQAGVWRMYVRILKPERNKVCEYARSR